MVVQNEMDGKELASADVTAATVGEKRQKLAVVTRGEDSLLVLTEGGVKLRSWPLHAIKLVGDQPGGNISLEAGGENLSWWCGDENARRELCRVAALATGVRTLPDEALGALLEDAAPDTADAELWARRLADRLAKLDALNVAGMLAAATEGGGAELGAQLEAGVTSCTALSARLSRYDALIRAAPAAAARSGAARADNNARVLLGELHDIYQWLDAPPLANLEGLSQMSLTTSEGRSRALSICTALRNAIRGSQNAPPARMRLAAVRERLRQLTRQKDQVAAQLARQLNNSLIHLSNAPNEPHHAVLLPQAPFMKWLKDMDEKAFSALTKVYVGAWSRVYEREVRAACEAARHHAPPADQPLDQVLTLVETICNAEQDFCTQFFHLDVDVKTENGDDKSEGEGDSKRGSSEARRLRAELFPTTEQELVALVGHIERQDSYGAMRALACVGRRVLGDPSSTPNNSTTNNTTATDARWSRGALAAVAVAAKRGADKHVADIIASYPDAVKQAAKKPKCGVLSFIPEFSEWSAVCEGIFSSSRRADLERWYTALAGAMMKAVNDAQHPRTPRTIIHTENYHRLHAVLSSVRVPALEALRRECRARYTDSLHAYVTQHFGRPLIKLNQFFDGVAEAVAGGVLEQEVCYRAAYSKHELRRILALYPPDEVRKSLHRLYRTVEKQVSEDSGLLQVVWRAMQEEYIAHHVAIQARITACYPESGLSMPLTTQDILEAFSDIAREH